MEQDKDGGNESSAWRESSLFLPFKELGLVIVDEEHDASYKQQEPGTALPGPGRCHLLCLLVQSKSAAGQRYTFDRKLF
jgi:hypothetical protein